MNQPDRKFRGVVIPKFFIRQYNLTQAEIDVIDEKRRKMGGSESAALREIVREYALIRPNSQPDEEEETNG